MSTTHKFLQSLLLGTALNGTVVWLNGVELERIRIAAKACAYVGVTLGILVLVWHSLVRGSWLPLEDNFDALIWLALLLATLSRAPAIEGWTFYASRQPGILTQEIDETRGRAKHIALHDQLRCARAGRRNE